MNNKVLITLFLMNPIFIKAGWDDWFPSNIGRGAAREFRASGRELLLGLAALFVVPKAYNVAKDTISPSPEVLVKQADTDFKRCLQDHAHDNQLTSHEYPIACRSHLLAFVFAKDALSNQEKVPKVQDLINEFQHYRRTQGQ